MATKTATTKADASAYHDEGSPLPPNEKLKKKQQLMSKRTMGWTSVKMPATSVGEALQGKVTGTERLQQGIRVTKVTSRGQFKPRILTISQDHFALFCTHNPIRGGAQGVLSTVADKLPVPFITRKGLRGFTSGDSLREKYVRNIDVADIDAVQLGVVGTIKLENARTEPRLRGADSRIDREREQIVSIVHHGNETLDVLIPNAQERKDLVAGLQMMCRTYHESKKTVSNEALLLRYIWYDIDLNQDGLISESEFVKILSRINFYVKYPNKYFRDFVNEKALVDASAKSKSPGLTYGEIMTLLQQLKKKEKSCIADILWDEIFDSSTDVVSAADFLDKFMHGAQGQTQMTIEDVQEIFTVLNQMEINHREGGPEVVEVDGQLSRARFEVYLFDLMNSAYDPWALEGDSKVPLNKPISMYWINASHNTYLTGDQLRSASSVEMYSRALRRGCKCLELDCWDGETASDGKPIPVVFHGHTLTSKILFTDIVRVVKSYMDSDPKTYPVILSLENHCSHPYQQEMARIMEEILGNLLYVPTEEDTEGDLPSPEKMRGKVIIKGKRPPEPDDIGESATDIEDDVEADQFEADIDAPTSAEDSKGELSIKEVKIPKIVKELSRLTLFHGTKFKSFEQSIEEPCSHMHSIGETKISKILAKRASNVDMWRQYNVHHMTRTYPAGKRVDSSNYSPTLAWAMGCQLVALNFQTSDAPLILNDGKFRQCQGAGYLEKPRSILAGVEEAEEAPKEDSPPKEEIQAPVYEKDALDVVMESFEEVVCGVPRQNTAAGVQHIQQLSPTHEGSSPLVKERMRSFEHEIETVPLPIRLKIRVLAGSCLPKPKGAKEGENIDPYVTVAVHDVKRGGDGRAVNLSGSFTTSPVDNNGFCPVWDEKEFKEFIVHSTDVAIVHFSLRESDIALDDKVADAAIPVSCLRRGYRSIQLFDYNFSRNGPFGFATLLVEIQIFELK